MNLRNVGKYDIDYNIGLDIGTGSVGWSVTTAREGELLHFKGRPTWGSRIFDSAQTAAETRQHRGQRRRYARRRWRLDLLQNLFESEINKIDPEFFIRLRYSGLFPEDRDPGHADYINTLFNDPCFNERNYFKKFPTIYHLRKWLIETDEVADIRLIYLALHNIVKHRGNFLQEDNASLSAKHADMGHAVKNFCIVLQEYCDELQIPCGTLENADAIANTLKQTNTSKTQLCEEIVKYLAIQECDPFLSSSEAKSMQTEIAHSLVGLKTDFGKILFTQKEAPEEKTVKLYLNDGEKVTQLEELVPEEAMSLFQAIKTVYSSYILQEILSNPSGKPLPDDATLSFYKVEDYKAYHADLVLLKKLVRKYAQKKYNEFFRGDFYPSTSLHPQKYVYDKRSAKGYTNITKLEKPLTMTSKKKLTPF